MVRNSDSFLTISNTYLQRNVLCHITFLQYHKDDKVQFSFLERFANFHNYHYLMSQPGGNLKWSAQVSLWCRVQAEFREQRWFGCRSQVPRFCGDDVRNAGKSQHQRTEHKYQTYCQEPEAGFQLVCLHAGLTCELIFIMIVMLDWFWNEFSWSSIRDVTILLTTDTWTLVSVARIYRQKSI